MKNASSPMFTAVSVGVKFVQPLNVGDHWITANNVLTDNDNEVQIFDSMFRDINESTVVQNQPAVPTRVMRHYRRQFATLRTTDHWHKNMREVRGCSHDR